MENTITCKKCKEAEIKYGNVSCNSISQKCKTLFDRFGIEAAANCHGFCEVEIGDYSKITVDRALKFILAGNAEFKIVSGKTQKEYYYKFIRKSTEYDYTRGNENEYIYWVKGGDSPNTLEYLGTIYFNKVVKQFDFAKGASGTKHKSDNIVVSILYLLNNLYKGKFEVNIDIYHNGNCGRCGKRLESMQEVMVGLNKHCMNKCYIPKYTVD